METSWYLLHIRPEESKDDDPEKNDNNAPSEEEKPVFVVPQVGSVVRHVLGADPEFLERDKKNVLWNKIQDGVRPSWSPDLLRMGFAVVFKREGLPKLAVKLEIKSPENAKKERSRNRILTFDDVFVMGCVPHMRPMYYPDKDCEPEDWWLATKNPASLTSPYLAPGGVTVATGAKRLADIVIEMLRTPERYPRNMPPTEKGPSMHEFAEFVNPLLPLSPLKPVDYNDPQRRQPHKTLVTPQVGYGWSGAEIFRNSY